MYKFIKIFIILVLFTFLFQKISLAFEKTSPSSVVLGNHELDPKIKYIEKENVLYINQLLLEYIFKTKTNWEIDKGIIKINFANSKLEFKPDYSQLIFNGKNYQLSNHPFIQEDSLWLPMEFFNILDISESGRINRQLRLTWGETYLLDLDFIQYRDRPGLELILTETTGFKNFLLTKPDRLVCQLSNAKVHPVALTKLTNLRNTFIKKVRFSEDDNHLLTLAFDLSSSPGYQVVTDPDFPERVLIVFNYFLEDLSLFHQGEEIKINIKTSSPADYKVVQNDSRSLIIDFHSAVLKTRKKTISGDGELIKEVLVEQIEPSTVRLSLTLLKSEELFVTPAQDNPNLIQIRKVQLITGIEWTNLSQGSQLVIKGDGEIVAEVEKVKNAKRLLLNLDYTQFQPGLTSPILSGNQGKDVILTTLNSHQVRVEIDLKYYLGYVMDLSPNKRQLRLVFQESPLVNQTFVLDPGHGGMDNGASGKNGLIEKELNLEVSLRLKNLLEEAGANVVLTRFEDTYISLYERAFLANYLMADFFVSIHTNSHPKPQIHGIEVFYNPNRSKAGIMATKILNLITRQTGLKKLSVKTNNFVVIRETPMVGILIELGFLSNQQEELVLSSDAFKEDAAKGIFLGIIDYFN